MTRLNLLLWITLVLLLVLNLFSSGLFIRNAQAQAWETITLAAGEKGTVYFYDGGNLWVSKDYGSKWVKIK